MRELVKIRKLLDQAMARAEEYDDMDPEKCICCAIARARRMVDALIEENR